MKRQLGISFVLLGLLAGGIGRGAEPSATDTNQPPANGIAPGTSTTARSSGGLSQGTNGASNWRAGLSIGAEFLNPYVISVPNGAGYGTLTNTGNNTVGYIQFDLMRRWVFAPHTNSNNDRVNRLPFWSVFTTNRSWADYTPDFDYQIGFLFANGANATNKTYSAQTLAGADIYARIGAGLPLWRNGWTNDNGVPVQLACAGAVGMSTEQSFARVHPYEFLGGALDVGLNSDLFGIGSTNVPGLAEFRVGMSHLDFPALTGTGNQVYLDGNGAPVFRAKWVPELDANVLIPFGNHLYLNVQANAWLNDQTPDQWNIKVGVMVPWSSVQNMFPFIK